MNRKPAARGRSETMPEMEAGQGVGDRQSKSLGGSATMVGSVGGGRDVLNDFSLGDSEVVLAFEESLLSGIMDAGRSG